MGEYNTSFVQKYVQEQRAQLLTKLRQEQDVRVIIQTNPDEYQFHILGSTQTSWAFDHTKIPLRATRSKHFHGKFMKLITIHSQKQYAIVIVV
jgi:hypothetical protein